MRARHRAFFFVPVLLAFTSLGASAKGWRTVDDFGPADADAEACGIATDASGGLYVVGVANDHAVVRYSFDAGSNWITRDNFTLPPQTPGAGPSAYNAVTVDAQGAVYAGGCSGDHWIIRRSADQGVTWRTVDDYYRPMIPPWQPGTNGVVYSLASDPQGRVYALGLMRPTGPSYNYWWIRGGGIGGANWTTRLLLFSGYGSPAQLACAGDNLFASGSYDMDPSRGLILESPDRGASWTTNFTVADDLPRALAANAAGNVYAAGRRWLANSAQWVVRRWTTNWTILDSGGNAPLLLTPEALAVDAAGNALVVGSAGLNWFTRQYSTAAGEWSTTDLFAYSTNGWSESRGAVTTLSGDVYVAGSGTADSGCRRWLVRKKAAPPRLRIAVAVAGAALSWETGDPDWELQWTDSVADGNWQSYTGLVTSVGWLRTAACDPTPGPRFFRLRNAAGP